MTPTRPVIRYHGGKWKLAPWVLSFFPPHRIYVEPFGGAGSVLMRKPRAYGEVYNDLEEEIVNVFRVLRDEKSALELKKLVELTPFARAEFLEAYIPSKDPVERARKMIIRAFMGFGSASMTRSHRTGFRSNSSRNGTTPAHDWMNWPQHIPEFIERLKGVVIENRKAVEVIDQHDSPVTLHYVDPPYPHSTRQGMETGGYHCYKYEMTDGDHRELADKLHLVSGMVIISGYHCDLYNLHLYPNWRRFERRHYADGGRERMEVLWMNDAAILAFSKARDQSELFFEGHAS